MNPLTKHFRQPSIYLTLPSGGKFWPDGSIDLPLNGQIPVYPMTTRDEITIRTPDALLNGEGIVNVIRSCCPLIKDPWKMPSIDVDAVLIAIRIASYGQSMDIDTICPSSACKHQNSHALDLTFLLDGIKAPNYDTPIEIQGLKIKIRPQSYFEGYKTNNANFEEQRLLQVVNSQEMSEEEKLEKYTIHMQKLVEISMKVIATGTEYIETEDGTRVHDFDFIKEFYDNADNRIVKAVRNQFDKINESMALPRPRVQCSECEFEYPVEVEFDYTRFFNNAS